MLKTKNAYEVASHVGKQTNITKELFNDKSTEGVQRYEHIQELLNSIKEPHCIVCGDTENDGKILQIPIKNGECILFCEFCYKIQSKMRN